MNADKIDDDQPDESPDAKEADAPQTDATATATTDSRKHREWLRGEGGHPRSEAFLHPYGRGRRPL